jgi:phosphatidylinositol 4-kinase
LCIAGQQEAGLPLWLRPYEVLVTSNRTSLIELVPNTLSIHAVKAKSPANTSLRAHFIARYGAVRPSCAAS